MNMPSCRLASLCKNWWSDWRTGLGLIFCYISERCDKDPLYMHAMEILVRPGQTLWFMEMRHNKEKRHEHATSVVICFCRQCWPHRPVSTPLPSGHFYDLWLFICTLEGHTESCVLEICCQIVQGSTFFGVFKCGMKGIMNVKYEWCLNMCCYRLNVWSPEIIWIILE